MLDTRTETETGLLVALMRDHGERWEFLRQPDGRWYARTREGILPFAEFASYDLVMLRDLIGKAEATRFSPAEGAAREHRAGR